MSAPSSPAPNRVPASPAPEPDPDATDSPASPPAPAPDADLPLPLAASVLLTQLPLDARAALERASRPDADKGPSGSPPFSAMGVGCVC
jgi:hypothetical protein